MEDEELWDFVEPCAGSGAISMSLLGATRSILPYQGSKWRVRKQILREIRRMGFPGMPTTLYLSDSGPWGTVWDTLSSSSMHVIGELERLAEMDPREVFDSLQGKHALSSSRPRYAAEFLFLQRLAFSGKAVGENALDQWSSPGFNGTSAYGKQGTDRFGEIKPMVPSLLRTLEHYDRLCIHRIKAKRGTWLPWKIERSTLVYIDPPYVGSTAYPNGTMTREEVVWLASAWLDVGASVIVSEAVPLEA